ncbi:laccase [Stereum hirsutum FP-91666 SS1]|uniref:laccase n=1 Tax=Stereum hirsutum (strain FP-91666) TaxID=721885 RepID=UPI000444A7E9|nr:laccase [Stereum hirsutum FP-91666 SS1]EIM84093.1 laccase [Stereum hirsutum FP-91666 SS1]
MRPSTTLSFILTYAVSQSLAVKVHRLDLPIVNEVLQPDGYPRETVVANGTFPGPLIKGNKGDNFQINVINQLNDTDGLDVYTTIHWHGINQYRTNPYDGAAFVTQCPIVPKHSFLYNFTVQQNQPGTFWYHSHFSNQYCDGLRGPLVIYDPEDPYLNLYDYDNETTVITLGDWYHYRSNDPNKPPVPNPDSTLINGVGRYSGGPQVPLAVVNVEQGKRYRLRLVSISCDSSFDFSIDGHQFTIIEADGNNVEPLLVDSLTIYAAQRYSIVLNASQNVDNYWIRAGPDIGFQLGTYEGGLNSAILRYIGAPDVEPNTNQTVSLLALNETDLHAREDPRAPGNPWPGGADRTIALAVALNANQTGANFSVNGVTYENPDVPVLLQILSRAHRAQDLLPHGSIYPVNRGETVEIVLPGVEGAGTNHPVHLHGHSFSVVRSAGSYEYNYENPVRRDVVRLGQFQNDTTVIRFKADNPGPWFIHCHIDWHLTAGFAAVMAEDVEGTPLKDPTSEAWRDLCPIWNQTTTFANGTANTAADAPLKIVGAPTTTLDPASSVTLLPSSISVYSGTPTFSTTQSGY